MKIYIIPHPALHFNPLYTCPRGEAIVLQGLRANPEVELVNNPEDADYYILDYVPHAKNEKWNTQDIEKYYGRKLIVVDWIDEHNKLLVDLDCCHLYFKRSYLVPDVPVGSAQLCTKKVWHVIFDSKENQLWPLTYGILENFPRSECPFDLREIDLGCYLRPTCPNRTAVLNYSRHIILNDITDCTCSIGAVNSSSRSVGSEVYVDPTYFSRLSNTKINIVCNPSFWIGDSRLWESLVAGCLTFVDKDWFNMPGMHTVFHKTLPTYDIKDLPKLRRDLKDIMSDWKYAEEIAKEAQSIALKHFTCEAIMRYIVSVIKEKNN